MKQCILLFGFTFFLSSCSFFDSDEKKAIEVCKNSKVQIDATNVLDYLGLTFNGLTADANWLDYANMIAKQNPNSKHNWSAIETKEEGIFLVSFADESGWGQRWEVTQEQQIVKHVNANEFLCRKYGLSRLDKDGKFEIIDLKSDNLKLERKYSNYSSDKSMDVVYTMSGNVINNSDKTLISADISGQLQVIFKDKTIESSQVWDSGFKRKVTKSKPWKPQEKLEFYIKTKDIEEIYLQYDPEYVFFNVNISAEDPIGFTYDKAIEEYDLKEEWKKLKKSDLEKADSNRSESASSKPKSAANQAVTTKPSPIKGVEKASESTKKPEPDKTVTAPAKSEASTTSQKAPEKPKVDQRAVMGAGGTAGKGTQPASGGAQGSSSAKGDEGDPKGTVDGRAIMETGNGKGNNSGDGFGLDLVGWDFASRPTINDNVSTRNGRIVFKITVDDKGRVVQAVPLEYNVSSEVLAYYRQVVNQISFKSQGGTAAEFSTGKITFVIKVD